MGWTDFVELIRAAIFGASHVVGGSLGGGILLVSFAVRLGLLPWTLRIARRAQLQQRRLADLAPELERLKKRWEKDPARLMSATQSLYKQHGVRLLDAGTLASVLVQWPLFAGLFTAVRRGLGSKIRYLWIADLASPNALLVLVVAIASGVAGALTPSASTSTAPNTTWMIVAAAMTMLFLASTSSALALSVGAGSAVSALQNWLLRREVIREGRGNAGRGSGQPAH
jgi:YidC/Oxa1 family membrane protein insertase